LNTQRPVNLNLFAMRFPITAITSILHRVSGFLLFLLLPLLLFFLQKSLSSSEGFHAISQFFSCSMVKFFVWLVCVGMIYHVVAGIRHLVMDAGYGEGLKSGRVGSWLVIAVSVLLSLMLGGWML
jgi:succinate dehydrogenase / fumarate reductase cytochrome b subunit